MNTHLCPKSNSACSIKFDSNQLSMAKSLWRKPRSDIQDSLYEPLQGAKTQHENVTPFASAGLFSRLSFGWLNPVMVKGKEKLLEDTDIPKLGQNDNAETCYTAFMERLNQKKERGPSVISTLFLWQWKPLLISGLFALVKVLSLATGPLLLKAFIRVAEGDLTFKYEGYALAAALLLTKSLESVSERQWYFRTRLIGLKVKSVLSAAIYRKQLRLSNDAKAMHSSGQIMNYVTVDTYKVGEFPYWFHQIWSTVLQVVLALTIIYFSLGVATFASLSVVIASVLLNSPLAKLSQKYMSKLMAVQDKRLKAITESLSNMRVLKLYAWEKHFKNVVEALRKEETGWLSAVISTRVISVALFWGSLIFASAITFYGCYFMQVPLTSSNVFVFLATLRIVQEPIRLISNLVAVVTDAKISMHRIKKFLEAPELEKQSKREVRWREDTLIRVSCTEISWESKSSSNATLVDIDLRVKTGEKVALCGEVGSGKSTLLAAILGEVPNIKGRVQVDGKIGYVSQTAWIQTGTIRDNILFGSLLDENRYQEVLTKCSLVKDLELLPYGDHTVIGERGVNLSGGQKQRIQLARALYQDADVYLLDDPFSAVDAHTASSLFNDYVMEALSGKTVLLVTHQIDFLPAFDIVLLMSEGKIIKAGTYEQLLASSGEFQSLVNAHKDTLGSKKQEESVSKGKTKVSKDEMHNLNTEGQLEANLGDQLIKKEERESGDTGLKPYKQYLSQDNGYLYLSIAVATHVLFIISQFLQNLWLASKISDTNITEFNLLLVYTVIGCIMTLILIIRSYYVVLLSLKTSKAIFSKLMTSIFRAPMSFFDSTPLGRILSRVSSDLSLVDLDLALRLHSTLGMTLNAYFSFGILTVLTWPILFVLVPMIYIVIVIQKFYSASAKELMRMDGTTKSSVASHLAESIAGAMTIRAFGEEERFFKENLKLIDANSSPSFHSFSATEWLIQRLEILVALVISVSALAMTMVHLESGYIGMALSYSLSLNVLLVFSVQSQCITSNMIIAVERLEQYMHIPNEAPEIIESNRPSLTWPDVGRVEIRNLKVQYRPKTPLVLKGISCTFEGGHKIGIVGRTGSGKTTLLGALFRLVEPTEGMIIIDDINISTIGLHDLRSHFEVIPQDPTLFGGSIRYNLDPLLEHTDQEIWEVLGKCHLRQAVQEKEDGLDSFVVQDGANWSMGQRQLFCLGRALLKKRKILVLDEATASIDNATDSVIQKTIRTECADCTVITVAHRIPTVVDCNMVLALSDGKLVEYDEPMKLLNREGSLFGLLVKEYWSHSGNDGAQSEI